MTSIFSAHAPSCETPQRLGDFMPMVLARYDIEAQTKTPATTSEAGVEDTVLPDTVLPDTVLPVRAFPSLGLSDTDLHQAATTRSRRQNPVPGRS